MKRLTLYLFLFTFLFHCERIEDVELNIPFEGGEINIYGLISESDSSYVAAFLNRPVLDEFLNTETSNSSFSVREGGTKVTGIDLLDQTEDFFYHEFNIEEPKRLETTIDGITYESDEIFIPVQVRIDSVNIIPFTTRDAINIEVFFDDTPEVDFYSIVVEAFHQGDLIETRLPIPDLSSCFDDTQFKNSTFMYKIEEFNLSPFLGVVPPLTADSVQISLYTISAEICEFSKSISMENLPLSSVSDPETNIFSNIRGARGLFGGFNKSTFGIKL